jgi:hypothetical protein
MSHLAREGKERIVKGGGEEISMVVGHRGGWREVI